MGAQKKVFIVGAGFSGLTLAYYLAKQGVAVEIYEEDTRVGGLIGTHNTPSGIYETAANAIISSPRVLALFKELNIELAENKPTQKKKFIWRKGLKRWPLGFFESFDLIKFLLRFPFSRHKLMPKEFETIGAWGERLLPFGAKKFLLETGLLGIYGAHTPNLSSTLVLGPLLDPNGPKRSTYRGLISPLHGMQELISKLEGSLKKFSNVKLHLGQKFQIPMDFDFEANNLVLCTTVATATQLVKDIDHESHKQLSRVKMHAKTTVTLFYDSYPQKSSQHGFGCLIPEGELKELSPVPLGILQNSFIFSGREKTYTENWIFDDLGQKWLQAQTEADLKIYFSKARALIYGEALSVNYFKAKHWNPALPIYDIELEGALKQLSPRKGLHFHGNYLGKIGLTAILDRSANLARTLAPESRAYVFMNIGTPDAPNAWSVGRYLSEFLMDPQVINLPWIFRSALVYGLIVPFRSFKSARKYAEIWMTDGSPLMIYTKKLVASFEQSYFRSRENSISISISNKGSKPAKAKFLIGMRYGSFNIQSLDAELTSSDEIVAIPLFPQYAAATTESLILAMRSSWSSDTWARTQVVPPFWSEPFFVEASVQIIRPFLKDQNHLLFSFHGLPEGQIKAVKGCDISEACCATPKPKCYRSQCLDSARQIAKSLSLESHQWSFSFQSRLGRAQWLGPSTEDVLKRLPGNGHKKVAVYCPSFVSDCLETLEEIALAGKKDFLLAGGTQYHFIPCVNDSKIWVDGLEKFCQN